jgi:hypothetical protein
MRMCVHGYVGLAWFNMNGHVHVYVGLAWFNMNGHVQSRDSRDRQREVLQDRRCVCVCVCVYARRVRAREVLQARRSL